MHMASTSKITPQSPDPVRAEHPARWEARHPPLDRGFHPLDRGFHLPYSADGAAAEAVGRGDRRRSPENHPLPAQSPSPSLDRGFGPFFASHFHACVVC